MKARSSVMKKPERRRPIRPVAEDSQESQEDYGQFDIDLADDEILASLEEAENPELRANREKDKIVCKAGVSNFYPYFVNKEETYRPSILTYHRHYIE